MHPEKRYPRTGDRETVYLKQVITNPNIRVGDFTMYHDFIHDPRQFEQNAVRYHYPLNHDKLIIGILQVAVLALMVAIGRLNGLNWEFYWSVLVAGLLFAYQQKLIAKREREACFKAFMNNNYVGLVLFLGLVMSYFS